MKVLAAKSAAFWHDHSAPALVRGTFGSCGLSTTPTTTQVGLYRWTTRTDRPSGRCMMVPPLRTVPFAISSSSTVSGATVNNSGPPRLITVAMLDEGMIHGGLYGLIQVRSQRPDACSPPSARVTTPARDPVPSGTLHHGHNRYRIHSPWNDHAVVPSPNPLHRHGTSEKRIRRRPATTFEELIPVLSTRFQTNLASIRASRSSFSLTGGDEVASRVADSVGVPGSGAG